MQFTWEKIQWSWRARGLPKKHLKHPFHPITKSMFFSYLDESQIPYGYPENVCMKCRLTFTIKLLTLIVISRGTWDLWVSGCPWHILGHTPKAQTAFQSSSKRIFEHSLIAKRFLLGAQKLHITNCCCIRRKQKLQRPLMAFTLGWINFSDKAVDLTSDAQLVIDQCLLKSFFDLMIN